MINSVIVLITSINNKGLNIRYRKTSYVHAVGYWYNPQYMIYLYDDEVIMHFLSPHSH